MLRGAIVTHMYKSKISHRNPFADGLCNSNNNSMVLREKKIYNIDCVCRVVT